MNSEHTLLAKVALLCGLTVIGSGGAAAIAQNLASDATDQAQSAAAFAEQIRGSLLDSCAQDNRLRAGLRADKRQDIHDTKTADPGDFPDIPIERFRELQRDSIRGDLLILHRFAPRDCEAAYPPPKEEQ